MIVETCLEKTLVHQHMRTNHGQNILLVGNIVFDNYFCHSL